MLKRWTIPKWMKPYLQFFVIPTSLFLEDGQKQLSIKEIEKIYNDELVDYFDITNFVETDRIQIQVKLLEQLHNEGII